MSHDKLTSYQLSTTLLLGIIISYFETPEKTFILYINNNYEIVLSVEQPMSADPKLEIQSLYIYIVQRPKSMILWRPPDMFHTVCIVSII